MTAYLIRRFAISLVVIVGIALLTFVATHVISPTPGRAVLGDKAPIAAVNAFTVPMVTTGPSGPSSAATCGSWCTATWATRTSSTKASTA